MATKPKTAAEKNADAVEKQKKADAVKAEKLAKAKEAADKKEESAKKVKVILRSRLYWKGRRYKELDEIEVTELQAEQLKASGKLLSKEEQAKIKKGETIENI